MSDHKAHKQVS